MSAAAAVPTVDAAFVKQALAAHYAPQGDRWLFLTEVRTDTGWQGGSPNTTRTKRGQLKLTSGFDSTRSFDALAIGLWPSDPQVIVYEVKVQRSDWLRELADPRKRAFAHFVSTEAWFAVAPGVVQYETHEPERRTYDAYQQRKVIVSEELDGLDGWGVVEVQPSGERQVLVKASRRARLAFPDGLVRSLLRRAFLAGRGIQP